MQGKSEIGGSAGYRPEDRQARRRRVPTYGASCAHRKHWPVIGALMKNTISETRSAEGTLRGGLNKLTTGEVSQLTCIESKSEFDNTRKAGGEVRMSRISQPDESIGVRAGEEIDRLREESARLKSITEQLVERVRVLEKRLSGLGWSVQ